MERNHTSRTGFMIQEESPQLCQLKLQGGVC